MLEGVDGQGVLEGDGRRLPTAVAAEGGAAMPCEGFEVDRFGQRLDDLGFADAGASSQHQPALGSDRIGA